MHIGLDARTVFSARPRGTGRNLRDAYAVLAAQRPDWTFTLYHRSPPDAADLPHGNLRPRRLRMLGERWQTWLNLRLPLAAWLDRVNLLHLPANVGLPFSPVPTIVTIHDLVPLRDSSTPTAQRKAFRYGIRRALRTATRIITPSAVTREQLCRHFAFPPLRVDVIPWAADQRIAEQTVTPEDYLVVRKQYDIDRPWLLNFSGSTPRKNATGIIQALAKIPRARRAEFVVVLVGCEPQARRVELQALAEELGVADSLRLHGFAPHEDLAPLLRGAAGLVMPSLCEGFGLPILDAFACHTPVLTSNISSMPEVAGDAAMYCDPQDPGSIADGMLKLLEPGTANNLADAGSKRLTHFTWERTAELMAQAYATAIAEAGTRSTAGKLRPATTGETR